MTFDPKDFEDEAWNSPNVLGLAIIIACVVGLIAIAFAALVYGVGP